MKLSHILYVCCISVILHMPAYAQPSVDLVDADGYLYDMGNGDGSIFDGGNIISGTEDAYDGWGALFINGTQYSAGQAQPQKVILSKPSGASASSGIASHETFEDNDREIVYPVEVIDGLEVSRKVYVPATGEGFIRMINQVHNPTPDMIPATIAIGGDLGSGLETILLITSDGDPDITVGTDTWFITDDLPMPSKPTDVLIASGAPALAHVFDGAGAPDQADNIVAGNGNDMPLIEWQNVSVQPGETLIYLFFDAQRDDDADAVAAAEYIEGLPDALFEGMSEEELNAVQNFPMRDYEIDTPALAIVDAPFEITVTRIDQNGNIVSDYDGEVTLTSNAGAVTPGNFIASGTGIDNVDVSIDVPGLNTTITAVDPDADGTSEPFRVVPFGDANLDATVNILDIIAVVNIILNQQPVPADPVHFAVVDMNEDEAINVLDLVAIVNVILGPAKRIAAAPPSLVELRVGAPVDGIGEQVSIPLEARWNGAIAGIQFDVRMADRIRLGQPVLGEQFEGASLASYESGDAWRVVIYRADGQPILHSPGPLVYFPAEIGSADAPTFSVSISHVVIADMGAHRVPVAGDVEGKTVVRPIRYSLSQNAPNPFNPITAIQYAVPQEAPVRLTIYNILGQAIRTLVDQAQPAGIYAILWNGRSDTGVAVASGVYFYRLEAGDFQATRRMLLLK